MPLPLPEFKTKSEDELASYVSPRLQEAQEELDILVSLGGLAQTDAQKKFLKTQIIQTKRLVKVQQGDQESLEKEAAWERQVYVPLVQALETICDDLVMHPLDKSRVKNLQKFYKAASALFDLQSSDRFPGQEDFKVIKHIEKLSEITKKPYEKQAVSFEYPLGPEREDAALNQWKEITNHLVAFVLPLDELQTSELWQLVSGLEEASADTAICFGLLKGLPSFMDSGNYDHQLWAYFQENCKNGYIKDPTWKGKQQLDKATPKVSSTNHLRRI